MGIHVSRFAQAFLGTPTLDVACTTTPVSMERKLEFVVLDGDAYTELYNVAFVSLKFPTETEKETFLADLDAARNAVANALSSRWKSPKDYQISHDFDYCFRLSGGVHSDAAFCREYVQTVADALLEVDPEGRWTYHTSFEIVKDTPNPKTVGDRVDLRGVAFIRNGVCYINSKWMKPQHRLQVQSPTPAGE